MNWTGKIDMIIFSARNGIVSAIFLLLSFLVVASSLANDPVLLNNYAMELMNRNEYEKALEQLQSAYNIFPYNDTIRKNLAVAYSFVGERQMGKNLFDDAAANFDRAHELVPENSGYLLQKGVALYWGKHYDAALHELEQARTLGGDTQDLLYFIGRVQYDTGNLTGALETWEKALVVEPSSRIIRELAEKARRELPVESRMDKGYSSKFQISYDSDVKSAFADLILDTLEDAYNRIGTDLNYFPAARIPVILYTRKDYRAVVAGPDWSGGLYDGKIRLPVGGISGLTPLLKAVLFHEYTHVVVFELTSGNCPTWLNEGLAEIEGRKEYNPPMAELGKAAKSGEYLPFSRLAGSFSGFNAREVSLAYQQSYSMVNFMVSHYGWHKVKDILANLGAGMAIEPAIAKAMSDYSLDYSAIVQEWQAYMQKEFGSQVERSKTEG